MIALRGGGDDLTIECLDILVMTGTVVRLSKDKNHELIEDVVHLIRKVNTTSVFLKDLIIPV